MQRRVSTEKRSHFHELRFDRCGLDREHRPDLPRRQREGTRPGAVDGQLLVNHGTREFGRFANSRQTHAHEELSEAQQDDRDAPDRPP